MPRPIETLLSLPRVRLVDRVPILETGQLIRRFLERVPFQHKLVNTALKVSQSSARQFSFDDERLSTLLEEIDSEQYIVTRKSKKAMQELVDGIFSDGFIFKEFEREIEPLCRISEPLRLVSKLADSLVDKTKEESVDVARALMLELPGHKTASSPA